MPQISRQEYSSLYGPTVGDKIRLGDTDLYVEIEKDLRGYGDEVIYGGGKTLRAGMGGDSRSCRDNGVLDLVITNATIIDAVQGVIKADVGIRDGRIVGIGKSGNPSMMNGVDPDLIVGNSTDAITGEHLILTAGGIDSHVHYISPQQGYAALSHDGIVAAGKAHDSIVYTGNAGSVTDFLHVRAGPGGADDGRGFDPGQGRPVLVDTLGRAHRGF